jgi:hypothetical protein
VSDTREPVIHVLGCVCDRQGGIKKVWEIRDEKCNNILRFLDPPPPFKFDPIHMYGTSCSLFLCSKRTNVPA